MTTTPTQRFLPMLGHTGGKRSAVTCALKCDNACAKGVCNTSGNGYFRDIVEAEFSRRTVLGAGGVGALALVLGGSALAGPALAPAVKLNRSKLDFTPIKPVPWEVDTVTVPEGFIWRPVIRWGDPLFRGAPDFDPARQTAAAQELQFGYNNDYTEIIEISGSHGRRAVMFVNHEYTNEAIMFPPSMSAEEVRAVSRAAHGLTVVELERRNKNKPWSYVQGARLNRRILLRTEFKLTGPAAGSALLKTVADPTGTRVLGTLGNCAGGLTPWGTLLSGEENFNGYFTGPGTGRGDARYGLGTAPTGRKWELDDPRFDTRNPGYENEANRFGYIVEVDPMDPDSTPRKHTALGRFKHEGANVIVARDGRVVAYSGDDERFDYLYKFVSKKKYIAGNKRHNMTLLSEGDLYVARFEGTSGAEIDGSGKLPADGAFDGVGAWLPLVVDGKSRVPGFSVEEVLVYTRLAADAVGPTKMDRCEDVEPSLHTGKVYVACTNNTNRGRTGYAAADEANPRTANRDGHVIEITEADGNQTATRFGWKLLLVCGDPAQGAATYFGGFPAEKVSPISCPDNLAFDSVGNLWISTDGAPSAIGYGDGLFRVTLEGAERGRVDQFLSVPRDGEVCGPVIRDEERTAFVAVQHPGEDGSYAAQLSGFPDYVRPGRTPRRGEAVLPRPSVIQVLRG